MISLIAVYMMKPPPRMKTRVEKFTPPVITPSQFRITKGSANASISWIMTKSRTILSPIAIRIPLRRTRAWSSCGARWLSIEM